MTPCRKKQYSKILINTSVHSCTKFSRHAAGAEFYMFDPLCHLRNTCTHVCVSATAGAAIASNRWTCRMTCLKIAALFGRPTSFGSFFWNRVYLIKLWFSWEFGMDRHFAQTQDCVCRKLALTEFTTGDGRDHTSRFNLGVVCPYDFLNLYRSGLNFHWCTYEYPDVPTLG